VAGCQVKRADKMVVEGQEFRVVGQLKRGAVAWADSFLLPQHVRWTNLFQPGNDATFQGLARASGATSVQNTGPDDAKTAGRVCRWVEAFSFIQVSRAAYWAYVGGYALLLLGGSGLFIACLRALARKNLPAVLGEPLREIEGHGGLLWSVHLGYFGLVIFGTLVLLSS
jgi:hypothetical protein